MVRGSLPVNALPMASSANASGSMSEMRQEPPLDHPAEVSLITVIRNPAKVAAWYAWAPWVLSTAVSWIPVR